jgi:hypothetical protein
MTTRRIVNPTSLYYDFGTELPVPLDLLMDDDGNLTVDLGGYYEVPQGQAINWDAFHEAKAKWQNHKEDRKQVDFSSFEQDHGGGFGPGSGPSGGFGPGSFGGFGDCGHFHGRDGGSQGIQVGA